MMILIPRSKELEGDNLGTQHIVGIWDLIYGYMDSTSRGSDAVEGSLAQVLARVAVRLQRIIQRSHLASLRYSHILRCIPAQMAPTYHTPGPSALFWLLLQPHLVLE